MKLRATIVIDIDVDSYIEAAAEEKGITDLIDDYCKDNNKVVWHGVNVKERRGNTGVDFSKMKFRSN